MGCLFIKGTPPPHVNANLCSSSSERPSSSRRSSSTVVKKNIRSNEHMFFCSSVVVKKNIRSFCSSSTNMCSLSNDSSKKKNICSFAKNIRSKEHTFTVNICSTSLSIGRQTWAIQFPYFSSRGKYYQSSEIVIRPSSSMGSERKRNATASRSKVERFSAIAFLFISCNTSRGRRGGQ